MSQSATPPKGHLSAVSPTPASAAQAAAVAYAQRIDMRYLVRALIKYNASDLHLKSGRPPLYRINGKLIPAKMEELTQDQLEQIIFGVLSGKQRVELEERRQVDLSFHMKDLGRFRCHVFYQRGGISAAIRIIPMVIPTFEELGVPDVLKELCQRPRGLLLVTGATGSGKSTTMAAMLQHINETSHVHILTIEDPIEYVYRDLKASITQREVGSDTHSFKDGLYAGLRQDPDVIMIGELRDCDLIQVALSAAETGHLVISTLHTKDAAGTIDRILEVFPADAQNQVRIQLASVLVGVVSQQLLVRSDGAGRVPACEVMVKSPAIENYILRNEVEKLPEAIGTSNNYYKMQTMNQALEKLVNAGTITAEEAIKSTSNPDDLRLRLSGLTREQGYEMASSYHPPKTQE
ncbi:MAG: type IV pilus twitching motility protein PilT [Oligoflexia bacterium]|nr:type IV pilus twitching motility protein PilT [Oligoflexia bacterium]